MSSTINKYELSKRILEDISTLELWMLAKRQAINKAVANLPIANEELDEWTRDWIKDTESDIQDRKRQTHLLKTMYGIAKKL